MGHVLLLFTIVLINNKQSFVCMYWTVQTLSPLELSLVADILLKLPLFIDSVK